MGQSRAAVDHTVGEFGHRERPVAVCQLGEDLELHVTHAAVVLELLAHRVLEQADGLHEGEVRPQLRRVQESATA